MHSGCSKAEGKCPPSMAQWATRQLLIHVGNLKGPIISLNALSVAGVDCLLSKAAPKLKVIHLVLVYCLQHQIRPWVTHTHQCIASLLELC